MPEEFIRQAERILDEGKRVLEDNRKGGRHRRGKRDGKDIAIDLASHAFKQSIGNSSVRLKAKHWFRKLVRAFGSVFLIALGAGITGLVLGGLGVMGVIATFMLMLAAFTLFMVFPSFKTPKRSDLRTENPKELVSRTEVWLEHQRPALPPPARKLVNGIGVQLDELQMQLVEVDPKHPKAAHIRKLVGEDLPEMIEGYQRIPEKLRYEERAGSTPTRQLEEGLQLIEREIDSITRQLAEGSLDDLAIRGRYLEYKYGGDPAIAPPEKT